MEKTRLVPVAIAGLAMLLGALAMGGCGGGSQRQPESINLANSALGSHAPSLPPLIGTGNSLPLAGLLMQQADCPRQLGKISISDSTLKNIVLTLGTADQDQLIIRTGAAGLTNLEACLVKPLDFGYTQAPPLLLPLLENAGAVVAVHLIVNGDLSTLREVRLKLLKRLDRDTSSEDAKKLRIVSYTQDNRGIWQRIPLDSTQAVNAQQDLVAGTLLAIGAVVTQPGYYAIE